MRTNRNGVVEKAEFNIDKEKYDKNFTDIFGERPSPFCEKCEKRFSFCECEKSVHPPHLHNPPS